MPQVPQKGRTPVHAHLLAKNGCAKHFRYPPRYVILAIAQACGVHTRWSHGHFAPPVTFMSTLGNGFGTIWGHWNLSGGSCWVYSGMGHAWIVSLTCTYQCFQFDFGTVSALLRKLLVGTVLGRCEVHVALCSGADFRGSCWAYSGLVMPGSVP